MKWKEWWRKNQSSEEISVPVKIQIWAWSGIVESSVNKSAAYVQYCSLDFMVAHGGKNNICKKHCLRSVAEN